MTRRNVLIGAAGLALAPVILRGDRGAFLRTSLDAVADAAHPRLSVGALEGDAVTSGVVVVPATSLAAGDASLVDGLARIRISGLSPGIDRSPIGTFFLDALVPSPDPTVRHPLPFYAWTYRGGRSPGVSNPASYVVKVERASRVGFRLETVRPGGPTAPAVAVFTSGRDAELPKLRPGTYLLGLEPGAWDRPTRLPADDDPAWGSLVSVVVTVAPES